MNDARWRVVKLGGSLLERADLPGRFRRWLNGEPAMHTLVVCGGGAMADVLRRWDDLHVLPPRDSHRLAIRLMSINAAVVVAAWLREAETMDDLRAITHRAEVTQPRMAVLDAWPVLFNNEWLSRPDVLPESWDVTSDSIAARVAQHIAASELVLLKSTQFESTQFEAVAADWRERAAKIGYVDAYFPTASAEIEKVRCVCLAGPRYDEAG